MKKVVIISTILIFTLPMFASSPEKNKYSSASSHKKYTSTSLIQSTPQITWTYLPNLLQGVANVPGVYLFNKFYVVLGNSYGPSTPFYMQIWDGVTWSWGTAHSPGPQMYQHAATACNNKIVTCGNLTSGYYPYTSVFDPLANTWEISTPLPYNYWSDMGMASVNNKCYAFGGGNSGFNPINATWAWYPGDSPMIQKAPMPVGLFDPAAVAYNGKIYTFGGSVYFGGSSQFLRDDIYCYDINQNVWTMMNSKLSRPKTNARAVLLGSAIFILGGYDGLSEITDVEIYYPDIDFITMGTSLPEIKASFAAGSYLTYLNSTYSGKILIAGGGNSPYASALIGDVQGLQFTRIEPTSIGYIKASFH